MDLIRERIKSVLASVFMVNVADIPDSCSYGSLEGWDSLAHMNLIIALEIEFEVQFSDDQATGLLNIDSIIKCLPTVYGK